MITPSHRILAVDDSPDNLLMLQTLLELEGYVVEVANCGKAALLQIQASPPNLVLLDMMMPEMNGIEVIRQIRRDPKLSALPILLVTANRDMGTVAIDSQPNDVVYKPIDFGDLLNKVETALRSKQALFA
jgi:two-component system, sensor histidine kinase and response regulator